MPAFRQAGASPRLGAMPSVSIPPEALPVYAARTGMVVHIDVARLDGLASENGITMHIGAMPGSLVHPGRPVVQVSPTAKTELLDQIRDCVTVSDEREFEQDPRFGIIVLSEIASRALSPAVNDPGTAIEVLSAGLRVFLAFADATREQEQPRFERVHAPDLDIADLFQSFFNPIARDGANASEVVIRIATVLAALKRCRHDLFAEAVELQGRRLAERAEIRLAQLRDRNEVIEKVERLFD